MESLSSHLTTPHLDLLNPPVQRRTRVVISMGRDGPDFFTFGDGSIFFLPKTDARNEYRFTATKQKITKLHMFYL